MKVDLRGQKDLGQIVGIAYRVYASRFLAFFAIALLTVPLPMLSAVLTERIDDPSTETVAQFFIQIAELVVVIVVGAALIHLVDVIASGNVGESGVALDDALSRLGALATTQLLYAVLVVASAVAFPYSALRYIREMRTADQLGPLTAVGTLIGMVLFFWVRWNFTIQEVMLARRRNWAALDGSADLVDAYWWRTLGIILAVAIVTFIPASFLASTGAFFSPIVSAVIVSSVSALVLPYVIIAQTLLYYDLQARREPDASPD